MEYDIDKMSALADYIAYEVSLYYEDKREPVGRMYCDAGSVLDVLSDVELEENPAWSHFAGWRYEIVFDVVTECGDDRCRECAQTIDAMIVVASDWRGVFKYEVAPGGNPVRVSTFIPSYLDA